MFEPTLAYAPLCNLPYYFIQLKGWLIWTVYIGLDQPVQSDQSYTVCFLVCGILYNNEKSIDQTTLKQLSLDGTCNVKVLMFSWP